MAKDKLLYREADNFARTEKSFYPLRIPVSHWQLRHYISTPEPDLLYYASDCDIYCLNTASKKRKLIATLPFSARCTASGYGWVCVGGEHLGPFAAIKLDGSGPQSADVDSALPAIQQLRPEGGRPAASVKLEKLGDDIVNSISIHRIQDEDAHLDDIVAVLTNNDKTVRMYSLPLNKETWRAGLPFPMNHSTISPDGQTLVAVGDVNQAYFFQREIDEEPPQIHKPHNRLTSASLRWELVSVVNLPLSEPNTSTGYFTTAWSPNGQLVAVGSEGGYISVFDIDLLYDPNVPDHQAIVATVQGSRPDYQNPHPGAIRSMMFSPDPWDLLIWAEDQGRICIGDLRTGLKIRQVVSLEPENEALIKIPFEDVASGEAVTLSMPQSSREESGRDLDGLDAEFIRRYRHNPDSAAAVTYATEYIESRRRQQVLRREMRSTLIAPERQPAEEARRMSDNSRELELLRRQMQSDDEGLSEQEQRVLESLRMARQREEARASGGMARTVNYTSSDMFREARRSNAGTPAGDSSARPISEILSSVQDSFPELSRTNAASPRPGSSYGYNNIDPSALASMGTSNGLLRIGESGSRLPRRRASVVLNLPNSNSASTSASNAEANDTSSSSTSNRATLAATNAEEDLDPWRNIEEHMTLARGPLFERANANTNTAPPSGPTDAEMERVRLAARTRQRERWRLLNPAERAGGGGSSSSQPGETAQFAQRELLLRRAQQLRDSGYTIATHTGREIGVRTAGLAMSSDGRTLWAACEEGIFEIELWLKGRMFWPSVDPR